MRTLRFNQLECHSRLVFSRCIGLAITNSDNACQTVPDVQQRYVIALPRRNAIFLKNFFQLLMVKTSSYLTTFTASSVPNDDRRVVVNRTPYPRSPGRVRDQSSIIDKHRFGCVPVPVQRGKCCPFPRCRQVQPIPVTAHLGSRPRHQARRHRLLCDQ